MNTPLQKFKSFLETISEENYSVTVKDDLYIVIFFQYQRWCTFYFNDKTGELTLIDIRCGYCPEE